MENVTIAEEIESTRNGVGQSVACGCLAGRSSRQSSAERHAAGSKKAAARQIGALPKVGVSGIERVRVAAHDRRPAQRMLQKQILKSHINLSPKRPPV